ncbi:MFS transporter [Novosphingobium sp. Chol11]|jgi:MFS family permease|uniref:MFS transporter n=1 Tax=Novosphingobium sp. Chol11 TaxID=1385763 RepID=UPI000BE2AFD1|nr:MFS transporter [Novosphingobium sp. Chol11]
MSGMAGQAALEMDPPVPIASSPRTGMGAWWSVFVLTLLYSLSLMDRQIISLMVQDIRADLGITDFQVGLLHGLAFALFYVTFGLLFGWAADRFSRRGIIFAGVTIWSIAAASCGLARNFGQFALARFGVGAGEAALNPAAYSILADSVPSTKLATALSVFGAGAFIGGVLAKIFGALMISAMPPEGLVLPLLGQTAAWRIVLIATGLPGLLIAFLVWTLTDPPRSKPVASGSSYRDALRFVKRHRRFFTGHFIGYGLLAATSYGYGAWLPTYLIRKFDLPITTVGVLIATVALVFGVGGTVGSGALADRMFARGRTDAHLRLFIVFAAVQICVTAAAMWTDSLVLFMILTGIFMALASYTGAAAAALQIVTPSEYRGQVSAIYLVIFTLLGIGLGPLVVGAMTTYIFADDAMLGWSIALTSAVLLPAAMLALGCALRPMRDAIAATEGGADR